MTTTYISELMLTMLDHGTEVKYHVELVQRMLNIIIDDVNIIIDDVEGCRMMLITMMISE